MRNIGCVLLALWILIIPVSAKSPTDLAKLLHERVTRIHMAGPWMNAWGTCTAFGIDKKKGWGITSEHCVVSEAGFPYPYVVDDQNRVITTLVTSTPLGFLDDDLALLEGEIFTELDDLDINPSPPFPGEEVYSSGFPFGQRPPFFMVNSIARTSTTNFKMQFQNGVDQGVSGSPVVDRNGRVVGVIAAGTNNVTEVIGSWHFQELLEAVSE